MSGSSNENEWAEPAFPVPVAVHSDGTVEFGLRGMSLRDWFAGMALQGLIASGRTQHMTRENAALGAYDFADSMLAARCRQTDDGEDI